MPRPRTYKTRAIVLAHFDLGEADRIITLLTPEDGKIRAVAKGVRRPRSRIGGSVEPFAELDLVLARGRNLDVITQVSVAHAWLRLRDRLESTATAWYLGELSDRAVEERGGAHPVYGLLRRSCQLLDDGMAPVGWRAGSRWAWLTCSVSVPSSIAASSATVCSRSPTPFAGYRRLVACSVATIQRHRPKPSASRSTP